MIKIRSRVLASCILLIMLAGVAQLNGGNENMTEAAPEESEKLLRHVVLFKFKDTATAEQVKSVEDAFRGLKKEIKEVYDFEWGTDVSVEDLSQGFTHCFFVTFKSQEDLNTYLPHPAHKAFVELLQPHLDKVLVVDYWASQ